MKVMGFDLSLTGAGWCVLDEKGIVETGVTGYGLKKPTEADKIERNFAIAANLMLAIAKHDPIAVGIEGYGFAAGKNSSAMTGLAELTGIVKYLLAQPKYGELTPYIITAQQARKFMFGQGQLPKELKAKKVKVKEWIAQELAKRKVDLEDENEKDAFLIAETVAGCMGMRQALRPDQLEIIGKIDVVRGKPRGKRVKERT